MRCNLQKTHDFRGTGRLFHKHPFEGSSLAADDTTNILKIEFDCRLGAIAVSPSLCGPQYQETDEHRHLGFQTFIKEDRKYLGWENFRDQTKYQSVTHDQITVEPKDLDGLLMLVKECMAARREIHVS